MKDFFILVNGILTWPGDSKAWTDRGVHFINNQEGDARAYAFEYFAPAMLRRLTQAGNARDLAETIANYPEGRLHLVGHSNGCDLIARAIRMTSRRIDSIHLISGAVDSNFTTNGLGLELMSNQVGRVFCYCSKGDHVLKYVARASQIATLGLAGYGRLGYEGPSSLTSWNDIKDRVETHWRNELGHSGWFDPVNFPKTMRHVFLRATRDPAAVHTANPFTHENQ